MMQVCDGVKDCAKGEDEEDCSCCKIVALRTPEKICDGTMDCDDGGDEANCSCNGVKEFKCYRCVVCLLVCLFVCLFVCRR